MSVGYQDPTRHLTSVLAPLEKRTLDLARRADARRVNSDHLTSLALVAMLGAGAVVLAGASVNPLGLVLVNRLPGPQLVWRQPRRHARARAPAASGRATASTSTTSSTRSASLLLIGGMALSGYMTRRWRSVLLIVVLHVVRRGVPRDARRSARSG